MTTYLKVTVLPSFNHLLILFLKETNEVIYLGRAIGMVSFRLLSFCLSTLIKPTCRHVIMIIIVQLIKAVSLLGLSVVMIQRKLSRQNESLLSFLILPT